MSKTTRRKEFDPRSMIARVCASGAATLDQLDPVAVRIAHEAQPAAALAHAVGRPLGLDALLGERRQRRVEVADRHGDVAVAGADLVRLGAVAVPRQLEL